VQRVEGKRNNRTRFHKGDKRKGFRVFMVNATIAQDFTRVTRGKEGEGEERREREMEREREKEHLLAYLCGDERLLCNCRPVWGPICLLSDGDSPGGDDIAHL
jgi:hypothetical protein